MSDTAENYANIFPHNSLETKLVKIFCLFLAGILPNRWCT